MELLIAGDLVPTKSNVDLFNNSDVSTLLGEDLLSIWNSSDMRIFNLEAPLIDKESPIDKCGPNLAVPLTTVKGIKALNPSLITLANNHILDQGEEGLDSTKNILAENMIPFIGIGKNKTEASKPYIFQREKLNIGVYACAEHEFSIATDSTSGANPFDPLESLDHIQELKNQCDYVIVLYHGGKEHYRYPSPYLQRVCRKMAQKGADLIICQHSHCIGSFEEYGGTSIIYGQGNFIFDNSDSEYWQTSLLVNVNIENELSIEFVPIVKNGNTVRLARGQAKEDIISGFNKRSQEILQDGFVEKKYQEFAEKSIQGYLRSFSGIGKWTSRIDRYLFGGKLTKNRYTKEQLLAIQNFIECEAHRELVIKGLINVKQSIIGRIS